MHINDIPNEILFNILETAAKLNERDGVGFTFGLSQPPGSPFAARPQRYVRGPVPPALLKMDTTVSIRAVCRRWHDWSLDYALREVYVRCWRGSERWCDLSLQRDKYDLYELIENPKGHKVYRDPYSTLRRTASLVASNRCAARAVRRLWFDGLYTPETDSMIVRTILSCQNLQSVSIPWTVLRHGTADDWARLLASDRHQPLRSLELQAVTLSEDQLQKASSIEDAKPLLSSKVDFSKLKRLKLFGDTTFLPVNDDDLKVIARTATALEEFQITCMSTVSIDGVVAIVRSSRRTLRVLEHSPRSMDGFWHPHPGQHSGNSHLCELLTQCPQLEDLSVSVPSMCSALFSNPDVKWRGDCQVRALHICGHEHITPRTRGRAIAQLKKLLSQSRSLIRSRATSVIPTELTLELFFADCIFDPHVSAVHGDFAVAEVRSNGAWPVQRAMSRKGPYGSTGLYGKDEETPFEKLPEHEYLRGLEAGYVDIE